MKRSEFLKSSALMGTGLLAMPGALGFTEKKDGTTLPLTRKTTNQEIDSDENYVTTVDLSNTKDWQFLYGSQLYGTMFGIFGKFETTKQPNNKYLIDNIEIQLINYKGSINLGFDLPQTDDTEVINAFVNRFHLELNEDLNKEKKIRYNPYFAVKGNVETNSISIKPTGRKEFDKGDKIQINRMLIPFGDVDWGTIYNDDDLKLEPDSQKHSLFDSEFIERDGAYIRRKRTKPGHYDGREDKEFFPSRRCHQAYVNISV